MSLYLTRLFLTLLLKPRPAHKERGDVPGWVLITVMTAGPMMTRKRQGMMQKISGKRIFTGTFCACSSAR